MNQFDTYCKAAKNEIFSHMLKTRGEKYRLFLLQLQAFKFVSMQVTKGTFLEEYYALMHYIDDVVDGDAKLPERFQSPVEFVEEKIQFARNPVQPKDHVDYLMLHCFQLAEKFREDFFSETQDILLSMLFDAKRYGTGTIFPEKDLSHHFHRLDIRGTVRATLKIYGEDPSKYELLKPLGLATRIFYNLRDYDEDIASGLVNVSAEDCHTFGIINHDLENRLSPPVQNWFKDQSKQGLYLLKEHRSHASRRNFGVLARMTFPFVYEHSARKYFNKVLSR